MVGVLLALHATSTFWSARPDALEPWSRGASVASLAAIAALGLAGCLGRSATWRAALGTAGVILSLVAVLVLPASLTALVSVPLLSSAACLVTGGIRATRAADSTTATSGPTRSLALRGGLSGLGLGLGLLAVSVVLVALSPRGQHETTIGVFLTVSFGALLTQLGVHGLAPLAVGNATHRVPTVLALTRAALAVTVVVVSVVAVATHPQAWVWSLAAFLPAALASYQAFSAGALWSSSLRGAASPGPATPRRRAR